MSITARFVRARRKMRQIASSDLSLSGKIRYSVDFALGFFRSPSHAGPSEISLNGRRYCRAARGARPIGKSSTRSFWRTPTAGSRLPPPRPAVRSEPNTAAAPVVLIDLGANIGLSAIALGAPATSDGIVAVEPDGCELRLASAELASRRIVGPIVRPFGRSRVLERGFAELVDSGNGAWGMRMGVPAQTGTPVWRIDDIVSMAEQLFVDGNNDFDAAVSSAKIVVKCDIEGAEAQLFQWLTRWEHLVQRVILELHTEFLSVEEFSRVSRRFTLLVANRGRNGAGRVARRHRAGTRRMEGGAAIAARGRFVVPFPDTSFLSMPWSPLVGQCEPRHPAPLPSRLCKIAILQQCFGAARVIERG